MNVTTNNALFLLPLSVSTRQKTAAIKNPISFSTDLIQKNLFDLIKTSLKNINLKDLENKNQELVATLTIYHESDRMIKLKNKKILKKIKITPKSTVVLMIRERAKNKRIIFGGNVIFLTL